MNQAEQIRRNTDDIQALTNAVTKLAAMQESASERRAGDAATLDKVASGLSMLTEKLNQTVGMAATLETIKEKQGEQKEDMRVLRHDMNSVMNAMQGITQLNDKIGAVKEELTKDITENAKTIAEHGVDIKALKSWKDQSDGARSTLKYVAGMFWTIFGTAILAVGYFVLQLFFGNHGITGE